MFRCCATSSIVDCWLSRIMTWTRSMFSSVVDVALRPNRSSSVTLVRPFLNMVIRSYTLRCSIALSPYCAEICDGFLPLVHLQLTKIVSLHAALLWCKWQRSILLTPLQWHNNWLLKVETVSQRRRQFVLVPARTISNVVNTTQFLINYCGYFSTHPRWLIFLYFS